MKLQCVGSPITHTKLFRPFAMSWQRRGNVVATGCQQVANKISTCVNGALVKTFESFSQLFQKVCYFVLSQELCWLFSGGCLRVGWGVDRYARLCTGTGYRYRFLRHVVEPVSVSRTRTVPP